jgi:hypothetical protein
MVNKSSTTTTTRAPKSSKLKDSEIMRIMLTYIISILICGALLLSNYDINYKGSRMKILIISIVFFLCCGLFEYLWVNNYLIENRENKENSNNRDSFHNILHILLPGIILVLGYSFLISGFKNNLNIYDSKSLSIFIVKLISLTSIIITFVYYSYKLYKSNKKHDENDTQVDILYSILHPVAILLISAFFYLMTSMFLNKGVNLGTVTPPMQSPPIDLPEPDIP